MSEEKAVGLVLVITEPARERHVLNELKAIPEISELIPLFGEYDIFAKVEAKDFNQLGQIIVNKIRSIEGIADTKTLTGTEF